MYTLLCTLEEEGAPTNKTSGKYTREGKKNDFQGGRSWKEVIFFQHCITFYNEQKAKRQEVEMRPSLPLSNLTLSVLSSPALTILQLSV